jgi:hypothetical protein
VWLDGDTAASVAAVDAAKTVGSAVAMMVRAVEREAAAEVAAADKEGSKYPSGK